MPLVGGTTKEDIQAGRVANLMRGDYPGRTTLMKLSSVSTLWDYINRAMPWNAPTAVKTVVRSRQSRNTAGEASIRS